MKYKILIANGNKTMPSELISHLKYQYPEADLLEVKAAQETLDYTEREQPDVVVIDLFGAEGAVDQAQPEISIELVEQIMQTYPALNIVVYTPSPEGLVGLKQMIDDHNGGFAIAHQNIAKKTVLERVDWALQGLMCTKELRSGLDVRPEWEQVITLAFEEGLQDQEIAEEMKISEDTVRSYWVKLQDALQVYPEASRNIRTQTAIQAQEAGLLE